MIDSDILKKQLIEWLKIHFNNSAKKDVLRLMTLCGLFATENRYDFKGSYFPHHDTVWADFQHPTSKAVYEITVSIKEIKK